jgi:tripartite-type tricarboxylate transporter receptor subunit TctC
MSRNPGARATAAHFPAERKPVAWRQQKTWEEPNMRAFRRAVMVALLLSAATPAPAQDYPNRPVTIVVPFAAGGGTDLLARMVAQKLEQRFGKPFLIENKPGAGSTIGANQVAKAAPDGHTLLMAPSPTMAVAVSIYKNLPYDPAADFVPLALVAQTPFALVVNPALPVHSVADLIKLAKEKPGELSFGSAGPGTPHHLYAELFQSMTGVKMNHVPYRGSLPIINDVAAGHLPLTFVDFGPAVGLLKAGKIRPIGISTRTRLASFPDIPPVGDTVPGFDAASWQMLVAPAGTPRPILDKLHAEAKAIAASPEITARVRDGGMLPMDNPSIEGLQAFVKSEIARWAKVVAQAGLTGSQ